MRSTDPEHRESASDAREEMERDVKSALNPCDDFYEYSCGAWLERTELTPETPYVARGFTNLLERRDTVLLDLLRNASTPKVAAFFSECVDMEARSYMGSLPLKPWLEQIESIHSTESLFAVVGRMHAFGMPPLWTIVINTDAVNPDAYQAELMVSGLGLPSDSLYMLPPPGLNQAYQAHIASMLELAGATGRAGAPVVEQARQVAAFEYIMLLVHILSGSIAGADAGGLTPPGGGQGQGGGQGGGGGDPPSIPEIPVQRSAPTKPQLPTTATDAPRPPSRMSPAEVRAALDALLPTDAAGWAQLDTSALANLAALAASVSPHLQLTPISDSSAGATGAAGTAHAHTTPAGLRYGDRRRRRSARRRGRVCAAAVEAHPRRRPRRRRRHPRPPPAGRRRRRRRRRSSTEEGLRK